MPKIFSRPSMTFDHEPYDSELVWLLGITPSKHTKWTLIGEWTPVWDGAFNRIITVEENGEMILRRGTFFSSKKYRYGAFIIAGLGTISIALGKSDAGHSMTWLQRLGFIALFWLLFAGFFGFMRFVDYLFSTLGDYARINTSQQTLTLCRANRTFQANQIIAFTCLTRYCFSNRNGWCRVRQIGILARIENQCVEWHPILYGRDLADRLAGVFQKPVRRMELDKKESKALNDS
jgi:hypothetical protein